MKERMVNYFFLPFAFSTVFCLLVASFESLEISAPDNVFSYVSCRGANFKPMQTTQNAT